jgi:hypothetical protein
MSKVANTGHQLAADDEIMLLPDITGFETCLVQGMLRECVNYELWKQLGQDVRQIVVSAHVEWDGKPSSPRTAEDVHRASVLVAH